MYSETLDHLGHLFPLENFQGVFLDQTLFFLTKNESTDSDFLWKQKPNLFFKVTSFDLNFEVKSFLKYIGWIDPAA